MLRCLFILLAVLFYTGLAAEGVGIRGRILLPEGMSPPAQGHEVVLLKYILTGEEKVTTTGPQGRVKTDGDGFFRFGDVPLELRAAFRIGTRVEGRLHQSEVFFMNEKETQYEIDLAIPGVSEDVERIRVEQASLILEAGIGQMSVTEIWSFLNSSGDIVDSSRNPLSLTLPPGYRDFSAPNQVGSEEGIYSLKGNELKITRLFPPGSNQLIFQYVLDSWFGRVELVKPFRNSLKNVRVFTPVNLLNLSSPQLSYRGEQKLHKVLFSSWQGKDVDTGLLHLVVSSVPLRILDYGLVGLVLFFLLTAMFLSFYFFRLKQS